MKTYSLKNISIISVFGLFCCLSFSQQLQESKFWDRVLFGGNIGANFGNNFSSVLIAPQAIYQVNEYIGLGVGLNYSYSERDLNRFDDFKSTIAGGSFIALAQPIDFLQVSADFEYLNVNRNFADSSFDDNYWVPAFFLGAGYQQGNFVIGARYDVLFNERRSVYQNGIQPFIRVLF
jgi:long-subunit fatty acid transport protein